MRVNTRSQRGEGKVGCAFWLLLLFIAALVGFRMIPVKIATMQLEDYVKELAMTETRRPQAFFEKKIAQRARELNLPVPKDKIKVQKTRRRVIVDIQFAVPLDFFVYKRDWNIRIYLDRDIYDF